MPSLFSFSIALLMPAAPLMVPPVPPPAPPPVPVPWMPEGPPRARMSMAALISQDDYPQAAIDRLEQGAVTVTLTVTTGGRVGACAIVRSSGSASIDATTCRILTARARFSAARDEAGRAVVGRVDQRIRWELDSLPFAVQRSIAVARTNDSGRVTDCRDETPFATCNDPDYDFQMMRSLLVGAALPTAEMVRTLSFTPGGSRGPVFRNPPPLAKNALYSGSARVAISRNGKVTACTEKVRPAAMSGRLCPLVQDILFNVDPDDAENRVGVWSVTLASRPAAKGILSP